MRAHAVNAQARRAHAACRDARDAAWRLRDACKAADPDAWRALCLAIAEATDAAGKAADMTAEAPRVDYDVDEDEVRESVREAMWAQ